MNDRHDKRIKEKSELYFDRVAKENYVIKEPQLCYPVIVDSLSGYSGNLLDIGCGEGHLLGMLEERFGDRIKLNGVDISSKAIENAKNHLKNKVVLKEGDSENLPFGDGEFDIIICAHSFHHYPNPVKSLKEMYRCLSKDGVVIIVENYRSELPRLLRNMAYVILNHPNGDVRFYSQKEMTSLFLRTGLKEKLTKRITKKSFMIIGTKG